MKNKTGFWTAIGIGIATSVSITSQNIPAGLFIGGGSSMLLLIITNLEVDRKKRN
jgi:zinc transporter ZupT